MVMDAVRGYVQLASGLTEVTKQKAQAAAKALLQQTGADALTSQVSEPGRRDSLPPARAIVSCCRRSWRTRSRARSRGSDSFVPRRLRR
jgi:hypothetical protein